MQIQKFADLHRLKTRIDEDGTRIIPGRSGQIYEYDSDRLGVLFMPPRPSIRRWGFAKRKLEAAGFEIVQDGDEEGAAAFDPDNPTQIRIAIRTAAIKRRRIMSEAQTKVLEDARKRSPLIRQE